MSLSPTARSEDYVSESDGSAGDDGVKPMRVVVDGGLSPYGGGCEGIASAAGDG
jgi:hypothetical protein